MFQKVLKQKIVNGITTFSLSLIYISELNFKITFIYFPRIKKIYVNNQLLMRIMLIFLVILYHVAGD
jgi:hypothetical protein